MPNNRYIFLLNDRVGAYQAFLVTALGIAASLEPVWALILG